MKKKVASQILSEAPSIGLLESSDFIPMFLNKCLLITSYL